MEQKGADKPLLGTRWLCRGPSSQGAVSRGQGKASRDTIAAPRTSSQEKSQAQLAPSPGHQCRCLPVPRVSGRWLSPGDSPPTHPRRFAQDVSPSESRRDRGQFSSWENKAEPRALTPDVLLLPNDTDETRSSAP